MAKNKKPSITEKPYPRLENPTAYLQSLPLKTKLEKSVTMLKKLDEYADIVRLERNRSAYKFHQQGFTYAEIATIIGVSPAVVKQYVKAYKEKPTQTIAEEHPTSVSPSGELVNLGTVLYPFDNTHEGCRIALGVSGEGEEVVWDLEKDPNLLIVGRPGSGKTVTLNNILLHMIQQRKNECNVIMCNPKAADLLPYFSANNVVGFASSLTDIVEAVREVEQEVTRRWVKMRSEGVSNAQQLEEPPPILILAVAETSWLFTPERRATKVGRYEDGLRRELLESVTNIARTGRLAGVHLVLTAQEIKDEDMPTELLTNMTARIIQGAVGGETSLKLLNNDSASSALNTPGAGILYTSREPQVWFKSYFSPAGELDSAVEMLNKKAWDAEHPEPVKIKFS